MKNVGSNRSGERDGLKESREGKGREMDWRLGGGGGGGGGGGILSCNYGRSRLYC